MTRLHIEISNTKNVNDLLDQLEESYILILKFTAEHRNLMDHFLLKNVQLFGGILVCVIIIILVLLHKKISSIITPLKNITHLAEKLSINTENSHTEQYTLETNYDYEEYQILANSLSEMHQRIHYENRVNSHDSASSLVGSFAENLAHLINNPLAIIATSIKIINKKSIKENWKLIEEESSLIATEIKRITDITHQMKSLIHSSTKSEPEFFKVGNLITSIHLLFFNKLFEKNIKFHHNLDFNYEIFAVENIVSQIIASLMENAIRYNDSIDPEIKFQLIIQDHEIVLSVGDNGSSPNLDDIEKKMEGDQKDIKNLGLYTCTLSAKKNGYSLSYQESPKKFLLTIPNNEHLK